MTPPAPRITESAAEDASVLPAAERPENVLKGLKAVRLRHDRPFPTAFRHYQVVMPPAPGVDDYAVAVDISEADDSGDSGLLRDAIARHWWSADHGQVMVRTASPCELAAAGEAHLDTIDMGLTDPLLLNEPGCPLEAPDSARRHAWVRAVRIGRHPAHGWVPYSLAFPRSFDTRGQEPRTHPPFLAGLGAGPGRVEAMRQAWDGLRVEDALWTWWSDPCEAAPRWFRPCEAAARLWRADDLDVGLAALPCSLGGWVSLAVIDDGSVTVMGGGAGIDAPGQREAVARALWQMVLVRALADPDAELYRTGASAVLPYRKERDYLHQAGSRWRGLVDPLAHVQLLLDPRMRHEVVRRTGIGAPRAYVDEMIEEETALVSASAFESPSGTRRAQGLPENALLPRDEAWMVPLSPSGRRWESSRCVRLLVPGACTLPLGAFPPDPRVAAEARLRLGLPGELRTRSGTSRARGGSDRESDIGIRQVPPYPGW